MVKDAPELDLCYKDVQDVYKARNRQVEGEKEKMQLKRLKNLRSYLGLHTTAEFTMYDCENTAPAPYREPQ